MSVTFDRRIILYPHYITASKTVAEGRRLPKELASENPNVVEMAESCKDLGIPVMIEDKHYPRDSFSIRCRLRVEIKMSDGTLYNAEIPNRRTLLIRIAQLVPKHKARNLVPGLNAPPVPVAPAASAITDAVGSSSSAASKGNNKKKKGK